MHYWYLSGAILCEVIATTLMKQSDGFTKPVPSAVSALAYVIAFYCLSQALKVIPTGVAYAIWSGVGIVLIAAVAWVLHGQRLDWPTMVGMALIILGVLVLNAFTEAPPA